MFSLSNKNGYLSPLSALLSAAGGMLPCQPRVTPRYSNALTTALFMENLVNSCKQTLISIASDFYYVFSFKCAAKVI